MKRSPHRKRLRSVIYTTETDSIRNDQSPSHYVSDQDPVAANVKSERELLAAVLIDAVWCLAPALRKIDQYGLQAEVDDFRDAWAWFTDDGEAPVGLNFPESTSPQFSLAQVCAYLSIGPHRVCPYGIRAHAERVYRANIGRVRAAEARLARKELARRERGRRDAQSTPRGTGTGCCESA